MTSQQRSQHSQQNYHENLGLRKTLHPPKSTRLKLLDKNNNFFNPNVSLQKISRVNSQTFLSSQTKFSGMNKTGGMANQILTKSAKFKN